MARGKGKKEYERMRGDSAQHRRIRLIAAVLGILAFLPIGVRLYTLMIRQHETYKALALKNQTRTTAVAAHRGTIYDRNMNILAVSESVETLYLDPRELKQTGADLDFVSHRLAELLDLDAEKIRKKASDLSLRYQELASNLEREQADAVRSFIRENDLSGIHLEPGTRRYYPNGTLAAQVIGFVNASNTGSEGVEAAYNSYLSGTAGKVITTKGNNEMDMPFSYEDFLPADPGCDVVLTLDMTVQACLENQLQDAIDRYAVQNGAFGMVMEVKTGRILAMATLGSYDPNRYLEIYDSLQREKLQQLQLSYLALEENSVEYVQGKAEYQKALYQAQLRQWRNRCISDGYEPGSTFKVLTMAAALDTGSIGLENSFYCRGAEQIPGRSQLLHCWRASGHGAQKTPQALQNSCNLAFAHIALQLGGENFYNYMEAFGVMEKTGIDLSGESKGIFFSRELITNTDKWGTASLTSGSFGQTFKLTPLQLVRAIACVVNGGYLLEPYLVEEILDRDGQTVLRQEPTVLRRVIRQETSEKMCSLLASVVEEGTAKNAQVYGYRLGGKTGTSEKIDVLDESGNPTLDKIVSFVGVAPMEDPQYIVLVALDTPSRSTGLYISGGVMAAPTVGAVMADILPYLGVAASYPENDPAARTLILEDLTGLTQPQAQAQLKKLGLTGVFQGEGPIVTAQLPQAGSTIPGNGQVLVYLGDVPDRLSVIVPNFLGMNRYEASIAAGKAGINILVAGNTELSKNVVVTRQELPEGTRIDAGTTVTLTFADTKIYD